MCSSDLYKLMYDTCGTFSKVPFLKLQEGFSGSLLPVMHYNVHSKFSMPMLTSLMNLVRLGVKYLGEKEDVLTVEVCGKEEVFKRHYVLEFDASNCQIIYLISWISKTIITNYIIFPADRKCMSVVIENSKGEIWLLIKGAESSLIPKCDSGPGQETMKHIVEFALVR